MVDAADTPDLQPPEIAERTFATSRRGYDTAEVRAFLQTVATAHRALLDRVAAAETQAADIVVAAEARAAEVLREAQDEARRLLATVGEERQRGFEEGAARAEAVLAEAEDARRRVEAAAEREAERLVAEAEAARSKVLRDLRRRRKTARTHLEQLQAARERLLGALAEVRSSIEATTAGLRDALPEAKAAADAAARRVAAEEDLTVEQLEGEIQALRLAGLPLLPAEGATDDAGTSVENGTEPVGERRSSAVRIVRPVRPQHPVTGLPEEELRPIEPQHPDEAVRLVTAEEAAAAAVVEAAGPEPAPVESEALVDDRAEVVTAQPVAPDRPAEPVETPSDEAVDDEAVDDEAVDDVVEDDPVDVVAERPVAPERPTEPDPAPSVAGPPPAATVDALFARLKSGRAERLAAAESVLDPSPARPEPQSLATDADAAAGTNDAATADNDAADDVVGTAPTGEAEVAVHRGGGASREVLLARRDEAVAPVVASLARRLKRVLADEQNVLLDELRRRGTSDALAPIGQHRGRWAAEVSVDLASAASAGARYLDPDAGDDVRPGDLVEVAEAFADQFAAPLHHRLAEVLAASDDDAEVAGEGVRAVYRAWRADRLGPAAEHAVLDAFAAGMAAACAPGSPVCWIVDDGGTPCPDAEDNALAGHLACGEPFPTGHVRPPAHAGCRCLLVPVAETG